MTFTLLFSAQLMKSENGDDTTETFGQYGEMIYFIF